MGGSVRKRILVVSDRMGSGDDGLGTLLMGNFLHYLSEAGEVPSEILLANAGVKLACEGSAVLDDLTALAARGATIRSCITCLKHFDLVDALAVGEVGTMPVTVELLMADGDVVTIA